MTDLVEWLRAQIAEDRRLAGRSPRAVPVRGGMARIKPGIDDVYIAVDTSRLLAECDAKLAIIDAYDNRDERHGYVSFGDWESCSDSCPAQVLEHVLALLALPYADRPGYREEWKP